MSKEYGWSWCLQVDGGRVSCFVTIDGVNSLPEAVARSNEQLIAGQRLLDVDDAGIGIYVDGFTEADLFQVSCTRCGIQVNASDNPVAVSDSVIWMNENCECNDDEEDS